MGAFTHVVEAVFDLHLARYEVFARHRVTVEGLLRKYLVKQGAGIFTKAHRQQMIGPVHFSLIVAGRGRAFKQLLQYGLILRGGHPLFEKFYSF